MPLCKANNDMYHHRWSGNVTKQKRIGRKFEESLTHKLPIKDDAGNVSFCQVYQAGS
jgi:hypothetical protein